jgi:hypothetical protein
MNGDEDRGAKILGRFLTADFSASMLPAEPPMVTISLRGM